MIFCQQLVQVLTTFLRSFFIEWWDMHKHKTLTGPPLVSSKLKLLSKISWISGELVEMSGESSKSEEACVERSPIFSNTSKCLKCWNQVTSLKELKKHPQGAHKMSFGSKSKLSACFLFPGFPCDLCDYVFIPFGLLNSHMRNMHEPKNGFCCFESCLAVQMSLCGKCSNRFD